MPEFNFFSIIISHYFLQQDFLSPHLKMFRDRDFAGLDIDIAVPIPNIEETGYGTKTQSLDVVGGV